MSVRHVDLEMQPLAHARLKDFEIGPGELGFAAERRVRLAHLRQRSLM